MSNRHFGRVSEVWKHLVLAEVLATERPATFLDTHAGDALYPLVEDPERLYGVLAFNDVAAEDARFRDAAYVGVLSRLRRGAKLDGIPGGPLVAMGVLGNTAEYLFCDLDGTSTQNICDVARERDVHTATVLTADGMASVHEALADRDPGRTVVFIDPFDHRAVGPAGLSALDVADEASRAGAVLVYWYGYNRMDQRRWIFDVLTERAKARSWWCGDVMVSAEGADMTTGDLGAASTPGTGFGLVCANASAAAIARCTTFGTMLAATYRGRPLPAGGPGGLDFSVEERA
jgi:23S rRNA (adenine2030-N6)-methyltransferase